MLMTHPILAAGFFAGAGAVLTDLHAWKSWGDVAFNWKTASYRWVVATVGAMALAAGVSAL